MPDALAVDPQAAAHIAAADAITAATKAAPDPAAAAPAVAAAQPAAPVPEPAAPAAAVADPARTDAAPQAKPPEQYALTLPPDSLLDPAVVIAEAQALGLNPAQTQIFATARHREVAAAREQINRDYAEVRADPELGGTHFDTTVQHVQTAMTYLFGDDVGAAQDVFTRFGLANNKVLVKGLAKLGHNLKEDAPIHPGRADVTATRSHEDVLYGKPSA